MTDITELAQSLKAAAKKATPGEWRRASTQFNGITATPFMLGRKEVMIAGVSEKRDAEFIAMANPANILALVEALEYYKSREERVTSLVRDNSKSWYELYRQVEAKGKRNVELVEALEKAQQRITQLESRTVKLPKCHSMLLREDFNEDYHTEMAYKADEVHASLAAAGIKVEAE